MPTIKLTDAAVQRFKAPPGGRVEYFDASLPGFGVRVAGPTGRSPEGRKSWVLLYRYGGEQRRLTLEPTYPALGLAAARRKAGDALTMVSEGKDPALAKAQTRAAAAKKPDTIENVVEEFVHRSLESKGRTEDYIEEVRSSFRVHILPRWKGRDIKTITRRDIIELLDSIVDTGVSTTTRDGRKRYLRGGPIAANRALASLRSFFNWALRRGLIEATPSSLVERPGEEVQRDRTLATDEIRDVWELAPMLGYPLSAFFRAALLTGQRRSEVAGMRWADVDLDAGVWTLPAELTKASRGHAVPLSPAMVELLRGIPRIGDYAFTANGRTPIIGFGKAKDRLDGAIAIARKNTSRPPAERWTIHDLRRTTATEMARLGVPRLVIGRVLNHADRGVTAIYDRHSYLAEKRQALEAWAAFVTGLTSPAEDNVVVLRA